MSLRGTLAERDEQQKTVAEAFGGAGRQAGSGPNAFRCWPLKPRITRPPRKRNDIADILLAGHVHQEQLKAMHQTGLSQTLELEYCDYC